MLDKPNYCNYTSAYEIDANATTKSPSSKRTHSDFDGQVAQVHTLGPEGESGQGRSESQRPDRMGPERLVTGRRKEIQGQEV